MVTAHSIFLVALVSQTTSALLLGLLAWSDRRARGVAPLAVAGGLHALAIGLSPVWRCAKPWPFAALSAALLPLLFFLVQRGLRALTQSRETHPNVLKIVVGGGMVAAVAVAPWSKVWSLEVARVASVFLTGWTAWTLWRVKVPALRGLSRLTAMLMFCISLLIAARVRMELQVEISPLLLALRNATLMADTLLPFSFLALYLAESKRQLHRETRVDVLTGLLNRRGMEERAAQEVRFAHRTGMALALLMMDLDSFKLLNDTWGHGVGDRALRAVGGVLLAATQDSNNTVARLGGEEFAMMLPDCDLRAAEAIAEQLRAAVASIAVLEDDQKVKFTVSIGVATLHPGEVTWADLLHRADTALYRAKREGRNRVEVCTKASALVPSKRPSWRLRTARSLHMPKADGWTREVAREPLSSVGAVRD